MDNDNRKTIPKTPFDNLVSPFSLDIMKLMIPYTNPSNQKMFAIFIKMQELQETIRYFKEFPTKMHSCDLDRNAFDSTTIISEIKPYLPDENASMIDTFLSIQSMMEMMKVMQETTSDEESSDFSMDFLKSMLPPEQQGMMDMFQQMSETENASNTEPE